MRLGKLKGNMSFYNRGIKRFIGYRNDIVRGYANDNGKATGYQLFDNQEIYCI